MVGVRPSGLSVLFRQSLPHEAVRMGPSRILLVLALSLFSLIAAMPWSSASAYNIFGWGCRYDPSNDDDGLGIAFSSTNLNLPRQAATTAAAGAWNGYTTPQFTIVSYGSSTRDLKVHFTYQGTNGPSAVTHLPCNYWYGYYESDPTLEWNLDITWYNYDELRISALHELGHSYGVDHNNDTSCFTSLAGLMYYSSVAKYYYCGWNYPTTDDVNGQVDAHNG